MDSFEVYPIEVIKILETVISEVEMQYGKEVRSMMIQEKLPVGIEDFAKLLI